MGSWKSSCGMLGAVVLHRILCCPIVFRLYIINGKRYILVVSFLFLFKKFVVLTWSSDVMKITFSLVYGV